MNRVPTKIVIPVPESAIDEIVPKSFFLANLTLWQQTNCVRLSDRSLPFGRRRLANDLPVVPMGIMIQPLLKSQRKTAPMQPFFEKEGMEISDTPPSPWTLEHWIRLTMIKPYLSMTYNQRIQCPSSWTLDHWMNAIRPNKLLVS